MQVTRSRNSAHRQRTYVKNRRATVENQPGRRWNLGEGGEVDTLLPQRLAAAGTDRLGQSDLDWGSGPRVGPGQGRVRKAKGPGPGLRPGRWGWAWRWPLEKGAACR